MSYMYGIFYGDGTIVVLSPHDEEQAKRLAEDFNSVEKQAGREHSVKRIEVGEWEPLN